MAYSAGKPVDNSEGLVDTREKSGEWKERSMKRYHIPSDGANNERESAKFPKLSGIHKTKNNSAFEADLEDIVVDTSAELTDNIEYRAKSLETFEAGPMDSLEKNTDLVVIDVKQTADYVATDYNFAAFAEISSKESYIPSDSVTRASDCLGDEATYQSDGVYQSVASSEDIAYNTADLIADLLTDSPTEDIPATSAHSLMDTADLLMDSPTEDIPTASAQSLMDTTTTTVEEKDLNLFFPAITSVVCSTTTEGKMRTKKKLKNVRKIL
jgi:hypothetical protein